MQLPIWRPVVGLESRFLVSNTGLIKSLPTRNSKGCIRKPFYSNGYVVVPYHDYKGSGKVRSILVHRAVAKAFIPNPEKKRTVNHIDSNRGNNHVSNLEWATHAENVEHSIRCGKRDRYRTRGIGNGNAILTEIDVINIKHCQGAIFAKALGELYGVKDQTIYDIWLGRRWKHLL